MTRLLSILALVLTVSTAQASVNELLLKPFAGKPHYFMHYTGAGMATYTGYHVLKRYTDRALWISSGLVLALSLAKELFLDESFSWGDFTYSTLGITTATLTIHL